MKRLLVLIAVAACSAVTHSSVEAQFFGKLSRYLAREALGESAEKAGKQIGSEAVSKAARTLGRKATSKMTSEAGEAAASKTSSALVGKFTSKYGADSAKALSNVSSQSGRRLAMMESQIANSGQGKQLMTFIAKRGDGDAIIDFLYRNSGKIAAGALIAKLITSPDEVLGAVSDSVSDVASVTGEKIVLPVAQEAARPIAHWIGLCCFASTVAGLGLWIVRVRSSITTPNIKES